jgi:hypothetical protein
MQRRNATVLVDPTSSKAQATALRNVLGDDHLRQPLSRICVIGCASCQRTNSGKRFKLMKARNANRRRGRWRCSRLQRLVFAEGWLINPMLASVIIPTKIEEDNIGRCLEAVSRQSADFPFEVLVIDSGPQDRTMEIVRKYPARLLEIPPSEFHHARTRNLGGMVSSGKSLVFLSGDAFPADKGWLSALRGSFLGRWPNPNKDFSRLMASSICQRCRYSSITAAAENISGSVVHTAN